MFSFFIFTKHLQIHHSSRLFSIKRLPKKFCTLALLSFFLFLLFGCHNLESRLLCLTFHFGALMKFMLLLLQHCRIINAKLSCFITFFITLRQMAWQHLHSQILNDKKKILKRCRFLSSKITFFEFLNKSFLTSVFVTNVVSVFCIDYCLFLTHLKL